MSGVAIRPNATHLYRIRAWTGLLLYVGVTNDVDRRINEHRARAPWFPLAHSVASIWHDGPADALEAERKAIRDERPLFNKVMYDAITAHETGRLAQSAEADREVGKAMDLVFGQIFGMFDDEDES